MKISIFILIIISIIAYGFYVRNQNRDILKSFLANKKIKCNDVLVQKSKGWHTQNNRFFSNGKILKTIVFCKVM